MGESKHLQKSADQSADSSTVVSVTITSQPSEKDLLPTEREKRLLQDLFDWQDRSSKTHWVLGQPLGVNT